jgi:hypothetical protein
METMLQSFTRRYNLRSRLCPLGPAHPDDCTNPWHQAHPPEQDGQFVVPRHRERLVYAETQTRHVGQKDK